MKNRVIAVSVFAVVSVPVVASDSINPFADEKSGFYLGGGIGAAQYSDAYSRIEDYYNQSISETKSYKHTERNAVGKLFSGYRINKYFAIELDYLKMDDLEGEQRNWPTGGIGEFGVESSAKVDALGIKTIAIYPINNRIDVYASLGAKNWRVKETTKYYYPIRSDKENKKEKGVSASYGLGANYNISKNLAVGMQWERINDVGDKKLNFGQTDIDVITASFQYNF
ncbi:outer membrane beta-barrel protein [Endozoicomonas sp. SM1973]|uniref:Outer membrane beta-barrel protein n=1 Tax=Spartinivicinus marinus TaxID=2994442 RepID=A0A853I4D7_9GAMM|nr:outer membrane beta-barrel protein [Spartinivicinus marinus]MCX4029811.1 outer membrane beta-barrel protein [Spartinivicinus marinus]NYZ67519.1 outer membrane beta-barrel protein [Spartinivicinus marinus]